MHTAENARSRFAEPPRLAIVGAEPPFDAPVAGATRVAWRPPLAIGDPDADAALRKRAERLDRHNDRVLEAMRAEEPCLLGIAPAAESIPGLGDRTYLHPGPPVNPARPPAAIRSALEEAWRDDGTVQNPADGFAAVAAGRIRLLPAQDFGAAVPGAGVIGPRTPVWVVGGRGKRRAFGAILNPPAGLSRLGKILAARPPLPLLPLLAGILPAAARLPGRGALPGTVLLRECLPALLEGAETPADLLPLADWLGRECPGALDSAILAAAKLLLDAGATAKCGTVVTAMGFNGTDFGVRLSGGRGRWFAAPVPPSEYAPLPDCGDSPLLESIGFGAAALGRAPLAAQALELSPDDASAVTRLAANLVPDAPEGAPAPDLPRPVDARRVLALHLPPPLAMDAPGVLGGPAQLALFFPPIEAFRLALRAFAAEL